jgi:hypothetical protein
MAAESVPYWLLISVLFSSVPLTEALATRLHHAALDLYKRNDGVARLQGDLVQGEVRNLKKDLLLGTLGGPGFEAHVDTERGSGTVRFLLTRQGIELLAERETPRAAMN